MPDEATTESRTAGGAEDEVLRAPLTLEYPFRRTTGPVIGAFMTGLREGRLVGIEDEHGKVLVPPVEYDPASWCTADQAGSRVVRGRGRLVVLERAGA